MKNIIWHPSIYNYLYNTIESGLEKKVLDCGAGGEMPPLALFKDHSFDTQGIEIDENEIKLANDFGKKYNLNLNIEKGDIRELPYNNESFNFVYSFHTVAHLTKKEVGIAVSEMKRVLKKDGLLYVNFISTDHILFGKGEKVGEGEYIKEYPNGEKVLHSFFDDNEPDEYFNDLKVIYKEKKISDELVKEDRKVRFSYIDYICKK
jgi:ubiquinone/menaquinone biosynthesis C-methylase UbiE